MPNYWLFKSEPDCYSIDHLLAEPSGKGHWEGVRNYTARNFMRDQMKIGDKGLFYHSSCEVPGIVGFVEIVTESYPDHTQFDPNHEAFDPKATKENPRWFMVDLKGIRKTPSVISLATLRETPGLEEMLVTNRGNRLSITPVTENEFRIIEELAERIKAT